MNPQPRHRPHKSNTKKHKNNNDNTNDWGKVLQYLLFSILITVVHTIIGSSIIYYITRLTIPNPVTCNNNGKGDYLEAHFPDNVYEWPYYLTKKKDPNWKYDEAPDSNIGALLGEAEGIADLVGELEATKQTGGKGNIGAYTCGKIPHQTPPTTIDCNERFFPYNLAGERHEKDDGRYNGDLGTIDPSVLFGLSMAHVQSILRWSLKYVLEGIKPDSQNYNPKFIMTGVGAIVFLVFLVIIPLLSVISIVFPIGCILTSYNRRWKPWYDPNTDSWLRQIGNGFQTCVWWTIQLGIIPTLCAVPMVFATPLIFIKYLYELFIKPITTDNGKETFKSVCKCNINSIMFVFCLSFICLTSTPGVLDNRVWAGMTGTAGLLLAYYAYKGYNA